jgi:hypothetical protein
LGVPVIPSDQPTAVVQPPMAPLHLPAKLAGLMGLWRTARAMAAVGPFPAGYGRLDPPSPQFMPEVSAVIAFVGTKAGGSLGDGPEVVAPAPGPPPSIPP